MIFVVVVIVVVVVAMVVVDVINFCFLLLFFSIVYPFSTLVPCFSYHTKE